VGAQRFCLPAVSGSFQPSFTWAESFDVALVVLLPRPDLGEGGPRPLLSRTRAPLAALARAGPAIEDREQATRGKVKPDAGDPRK